MDKLTTDYNDLNEDQIKKIEKYASYSLSFQEIITKLKLNGPQFFKYLNNNPDLEQKLRNLKETPKIDAKITLALKLADHDKPDLALKVLERIAKDTYSPQQNIKAEVDTNVTINSLIPTPEGNNATD